MFDVLHMFRIRGSIFMKKAVYTVMVWYVLHASVYTVLNFTYKTVCTDACNTHCTITVYTTALQKMNPPVRNMYKTPNIRN
jgi:hypothetical protein